MVRHTICQQVLSMLHHTPSHITDLTASSGWESLFLWLLTPFEPNSRDGTPEAKAMEGLSLEEEDESLKSPVTYIDLSTVQTAACPSSLEEADSDDNRLPDLTFMEASVNATSVKREESPHPQVTHPQVMPKRPRHFSMPPSNHIVVAEDDRLGDGIRGRSTAFLDSSTKGERHISVTKNRVVDEGSRRSFMTKRRSLTYSRSWGKLSNTEGEEIKRTFSVVTETIAHLLWNSVDYEKDLPPWKVMSYYITVMCHIV